MGTQRQPSWLSGILIPWRLTLGGTLGTSYTVADGKPGRFVADGTSLLSLTPSLAPGVSMASGVTSLDAQTIRPGAPGPKGAGIAYRVNGSGLWYGCDSPDVLTGYSFIDSTASGDVTAVTRTDGSVVICYTSSSNVYVQIRNASGVWGSASSILSTTQQLACICTAPDGALHVYAADTLPGTTNVAIRCLRSTDGGGTWTRQAYDVGVFNGASADVGDFLRAASANGTVVLFRSVTSTTTAYQWVSSDGGFNFSAVANNANTTVRAVVPFGGVLHVLTTEKPSASTDTFYRRFAAFTQSLWNTDAVQVTTTGSFSNASTLTVAPHGVMYATVSNASATDAFDARVSYDGGVSWSGGGPDAVISVSSDYVKDFTSAWVRGTLLIIGSTTGLGSGSSSDLVELRYGGHSQCTFSGDKFGTGFQYLPIQSTASAGYTETDSGTVTRTFTPTGGQQVNVGLGSSATTRSAATVSNSSAVFLMRVKASSGTSTIECETNGVTLAINLSPTTIVAYDSTGAAGSTTAHGASDEVDIIAIVDRTNARAFAAFRIADDGPERQWTELPAVTGMGAAGTRVRHAFVQGASDNFFIVWASHWLLEGSGLSNGWSRPTELDPVMLAVPPTFSYLSSGVDVQSSGGIAAVDGVTHTSTMTSVYRAENVIPQTAPSPSAPWRSSQVAADESLTLTLDAADRPGVIGLYLDGLVGVSSVEVTAGLSATTVSLAQTIKYTTLSGTKTIEPSPTGALVVGGPWVKADELRGWRFKDASGGVHEVTGNSEGSLTYGSPSSEHRAVIYLATAAAAGVNATGTLYPARALLFGYPDSNDDVTSVTIAIDSSTNYTPTEGYRQIGIALVGRVHLFGYAPDLNDSLTLDSAANFQTLQNGQRYDGRDERPDRRRVEIAFANSTHEAFQMFGASTSPSYVLAYTGGPKAASASGIPLMIEGLFRRAANASDGLVVWCPRVPTQSSATWVAQVWNLDATVYGRLASSYRREAVQLVGATQDSQTFRVPTIVIEEEL